MNEKLAKVVVTLNNENGIDYLLDKADKFEATQITNYEGLAGKPIFEFSIVEENADKFAEEVLSEFTDSVEKK